MKLHEAWEGVMVEYTEQDFPNSKPYQRQVPGWKCKACGFQIGTSGLPPLTCKCGQTYEREAPVTARKA
jgi:hypothetical protein